MKSEKEKSFSDSGAYKDKTQDKIELMSCHIGENSCKRHLWQINQKYALAQNSLLEKDYLSSIEALKEAFFIATELKESSCLKCADFFRSTITQSLENINKELKMLTSGFLRRKKFKSSYIVSCNVLEELKKCG